MCSQSAFFCFELFHFNNSNSQRYHPIFGSCSISRLVISPLKLPKVIQITRVLGLELKLLSFLCGVCCCIWQHNRRGLEERKEEEEICSGHISVKSSRGWRQRANLPNLPNLPCILSLETFNISLLLQFTYYLIMFIPLSLLAVSFFYVNSGRRSLSNREWGCG